VRKDDQRMLRRTRRSAVVLLAGALAVSTLGACGGGDDGAQFCDSLATVVEKGKGLTLIKLEVPSDVPRAKAVMLDFLDSLDETLGRAPEQIADEAKVLADSIVPIRRAVVEADSVQDLRTRFPEAVGLLTEQFQKRTDVRGPLVDYVTENCTNLDV
jgi:hypothetical protein